MNAEQFAERIADRVYTGYAASGPGLRDKIKRVVRETLAEYEPEGLARLIADRVPMPRDALELYDTIYRVALDAIANR